MWKTIPNRKDETVAFLVSAKNKLEDTGRVEMLLQSNLFITDTKGTGISVRIIEVSILEK